MTTNTAASVKARLLLKAKAMGEEFERTLVRYASERLLYRLGASGARERCVLKGASLLSVWLPNPHRTTRDIDLLAFGASDEDVVRALIAEICAIPCPEDGLRFDTSDMSIANIRAEEEYVGKRARFHAHLDRARILIQMDIGFGDAVGIAWAEIECPVFLNHLPPARLRAYPPEAAIAEKLEAMVKLDTRNSRMKDFHDIWALSTSFSFEGRTLRQAVSSCFERRRVAWTADAPRTLTPAFYQIPEIKTRWMSYRNSDAVVLPPPEGFAEIGEQIIRFLGPVHESIRAGDPFERRWPAGGPWQPGTSMDTGDEGDA